MCLLKVYLEEGGERKFIAKDIALVIKEEDMIKLYKIETGNVINIENTDISSIDTINSIMIIKYRK
ncbi:MAG: hypothetical protein QXF09_00405 [Nitrososphaerota archaeon]